ASSEPDERLEPNYAAGDAILQHRPARNGTQRVQSRRWAGRSGLGGAVLASKLGQLGPRSGTYSHLPDGDLTLHRPGQMAARPYRRGRLPHQDVLHRRVPTAMVLLCRGTRPARYQPDEPATHRLDLLRRGLELRLLWEYSCGLECAVPLRLDGSPLGCLWPGGVNGAASNLNSCCGRV